MLLGQKNQQYLDLKSAYKHKKNEIQSITFDLNVIAMLLKCCKFINFD